MERKRILIVTSEHTGHGHKSVSSALDKEFNKKYSNSIEVRVVNAFAVGGLFYRTVERLYNPCVKYLPHIWKTIFSLSSLFPGFANKLNAILSGGFFLVLFKFYKPDLILSLHPMYTGSLINVLQFSKLDNIKFYALTTDLLGLTRIWIDKRADYMIASSKEGQLEMYKNGVSKDKCVCFGLPLREGFVNEKIKSKDDIDKFTNREGKIKILVLNNSEKNKKLKYIVERLLDKYECNITVICGRSRHTYRYMTEAFKNFENRIDIVSYVADMPKYLVEHDILITRCGPTAIIEAINCLIPIISMGALPGQEEPNPAFVEKNNYGLNTKNTDDILHKIDLLLKDNRKRLIEIRKSQFDYEGRNATENVVKFIASNIAKN